MIDTILYNFTVAVIVLAFGAGYSLNVAQQKVQYKNGVEAGQISLVADRLEHLRPVHKGGV